MDVYLVNGQLTNRRVICSVHNEERIRKMLHATYGTEIHVVKDGDRVALYWHAPNHDGMAVRK